MVGTPIAGRTRAETEGLIGFFVNTLVLRTDLSRRADASASCSRGCARRALGAYAHQDLPFERLVEELAARARPRAASPLFQVMFVLQNAPRGRCELAGARPLRRSSAEHGTAKFDLTLALGETARAGCAATLEYSTDLFDAATIERLLGALPAAARGRRRRARTRLSASCRCSPRRSARQLARRRGTTRAAELPEARLRPRAVRGAGGADARTPSPWSSSDERLTYRELDAPRQPARAPPARRSASGPTCWSGSACERSLEMVVGHARHPQGRRRLRAARPGVPARAARLHARGRRAPVLLTAASALRRRAARRRRRRSSASTPTGRDRRGEPRRAPGARRAAGQPRLRDLHLGLDRPAQGRDRSRTAAVVNCLALDAREPYGAGARDAVLPMHRR